MNSEIGSTLALGILAAFLFVLSWRKGFFALPPLLWEVPIRFVHLIGAFAIYFLITFFSTSFILIFLKKQVIANYLAYSSWLNFAASFAIFIALVIYWRFLSKPLRMGLLHRGDGHHSFKEDLWVAFQAWIVAFPLVLFLSQTLELIINQIFHITQLPDQLAVKFLKSTFENPLYFLLAVLSIVLLAPLIEETLFRGFLQSYIRKHLGPKQAILITSVCFSLFHYSSGQALSNISIIIPLFVLSIFLGFLYEKQGSLLAPMALHSCFNTISVINLYLFGGFTTGL